MYFSRVIQLALLSIGCLGPFVVAQLDPTNLSNWPSCAQRCIPLGFSSPANCKSLSDLNCVCKNPAFTLSIADCEQQNCTLLEKKEIQQLSVALCNPVGGLGPAVSSAASSFLATYTGGLPATPVIVVPPGKPTVNITGLGPYPNCDAQCAYVARAVVKSCDTTQKSCRCSPDFRGMTAQCVQLNCTTAEENLTNDLDDSYCGSLYEANATLSSSVAAAIASGTKAAQALIATATATGGATLGSGANTTIAGTGMGMPSPTAFTGVAPRMQNFGLATATVLVAGISALVFWL